MSSRDVTMQEEEGCSSTSQSTLKKDQDISSEESSLYTELQPAVKCRWSGCGEWFSNLSELATHVSDIHAVAGSEGLFYCCWEGCHRTSRGFNARYKMLVHVRTHTNEKPHKCFECHKSFSRAENLKIHARSHTGEKPYCCPVPGCHKAYSNSSDRFKHTRTHAIEKPYECKVPGCSKRYTDPSSLRKHAKTYNHFNRPTFHSDQNSGKRQEAEQMVVPKTEDNQTVQIECVTTHFSSTWLQTFYPSTPLSWSKLEEQDAPLDLTTHPASYH